MFDLTTYPKKWEIPQLKTVFSTLDTLCPSARTGVSHTNDLNLDGFDKIGYYSRFT